MNGESILRAGPLELHRLRERHIDDLWRMYRATRPELLPYMSWAVKQTTREHVAEFVNNVSRDIDAGKELVHLVFDAHGQAVAVIGFHNISVEHRHAEMGFWTRTAHTGRGVCTAAAARQLRHGFDEMGFHRVMIRHGIGNEASRRVIAKLGFVHEGAARDDTLIGDRFVTHEIYSLLEADYARLRHRIQEFETAVRPG